MLICYRFDSNSLLFATYKQWQILGTVTNSVRATLFLHNLNNILIFKSMVLTNFLRVVFNWWTPDQCTERRKNIKRLRSIIRKQQNNSYFCHKANRESSAWELFLSSCKYLDKWSVWPRVQADQNKRMKSSKILVHTGQWPVMLHLARLSNIKKNFFPHRGNLSMKEHKNIKYSRFNCQRQTYSVQQLKIKAYFPF